MAPSLKVTFLPFSNVAAREALNLSFGASDDILPGLQRRPVELGWDTGGIK